MGESDPDIAVYTDRIKYATRNTGGLPPDAKTGGFFPAIKVYQQPENLAEH